jgi:hypothetical protein
MTDKAPACCCTPAGNDLKDKQGLPTGAAELRDGEGVGILGLWPAGMMESWEGWERVVTRSR